MTRITLQDILSKCSIREINDCLPAEVTYTAPSKLETSFILIEVAWDDSSRNEVTGGWGLLACFGQQPFINSKGDWAFMTRTVPAYTLSVGVAE